MDTGPGISSSSYSVWLFDVIILWLFLFDHFNISLKLDFTFSALSN